jgi:hypothetical protein
LLLGLRRAHGGGVTRRFSLLRKLQLGRRLRSGRARLHQLRLRASQSPSHAMPRVLRVATLWPGGVVSARCTVGVVLLQVVHAHLHTHLPATPIIAMPGSAHDAVYSWHVVASAGSISRAVSAACASSECPWEHNDSPQGPNRSTVSPKSLWWRSCGAGQRHRAGALQEHPEQVGQSRLPRWTFASSTPRGRPAPMGGQVSADQDAQTAPPHLRVAVCVGHLAYNQSSVWTTPTSNRSTGACACA